MLLYDLFRCLLDSSLENDLSTQINSVMCKILDYKTRIIKYIL